MNNKDRLNLVKLTKSIYANALKDPSEANLQCIDNLVTFDCEGAFKILLIKFTGNIYIYNKLPNGYQISLGKDKIIITNRLGRLLKDNILFEFSGTFDPVNAIVYTFGSNIFSANIFNKNKLDIISQSKTNIEDETLIFLEDDDFSRNDQMSRGSYSNKIDDDSVKGLYTTTPFEDGHTGYYTYFPKEKVYMSGKTLNNESKPISRNINKYSSISNKKKLNKVYSKIRKNINIKGIERQFVEKPIKVVDKKLIPIKEEKKILKKIIKKGGKY